MSLRSVLLGAIRAKSDFFIEWNPAKYIVSESFLIVKELLVKNKVFIVDIKCEVQAEDERSKRNTKLFVNKVKTKGLVIIFYKILKFFQVIEAAHSRRDSFTKVKILVYLPNFVSIIWSGGQKYPSLDLDRNLYFYYI